MSKKQHPSQPKKIQRLIEVRKSLEPWETPREVAINRAKAIELARKQLEERKAAALAAKIQSEIIKKME